MKGQKKAKGFFRLMQIAGKKKKWVITAVLLSIVSSIAQFFPYVAVYHIMKELINNANHIYLISYKKIEMWGYLSLASVIVYGVLMYISVMCSHIAAFNILYELRVALASKLVKLPMGYFTKKTSGEIKKIMFEDVERIELFVAHHFPDFITAIVFPLLILSFLFYMDVALASTMLVIFTIAIWLQIKMMGSKQSKALSQQYHEALSKMNNSIVEYVRGIQVIKIFNKTLFPFERLKRDILYYKESSINISQQFSGTYTNFLTILSSTILVVIPVAVYLLISSNNYPHYATTVFLFFIFGTGMFFPMLKLMWIGGMFNQNSTGVEIIDELLNKRELPESIHEITPNEYSVTFNNVSFAYDDINVLENISFSARAGKITALVGKSGSGKSTIGMLIGRFWDVGGGDIFIGNVPIKEISLENLMNMVSFVFQDNLLFYDTIEENIRMGNKTASLQEVKKAAQAAMCNEFIEKLPDGYNTFVGENGTYLSGGEIQRICLARAILKNSPILVLDEATAFADPENESKILSAFSNIIKNKTVIVIAHRLKTIVDANEIIVLNNGKIVEQGIHEDLIRQGKHYYELWRNYLNISEWQL